MVTLRLTVSDPAGRQRLLRALPPGTLAKVWGLLAVPPLVPLQERDPGSGRPAAGGDDAGDVEAWRDRCYGT